MNRKIQVRIGLVLAGLVLALQACSPPATPLTLYVSTGGNDSNNCLSSAHACLTVAAAITKATPRSTINIAAGTFPVGLIVSKWLTFNGAGQPQTILSYTNPSGAAISIADTVHASFSNLTVRGGNYCIELAGTTIITQLSASNITISNCSYGILNRTGGAIVLNNVSLLNNEVGIGTIGGTLSALQTIFRGNTTRALENASVSVLDHVTIDQNGSAVTSPNGDAAVVNRISNGHTGHLKIVYSTITNNHEDGFSNLAGTSGLGQSRVANNAGGGVINSALLEIVNSVITGNGANGVENGLTGLATSALSIDRTAIYANTGSGVLNDIGTTSITNSTISRNAYGLVNGTGTLNLSFVTVAFNTGSGLTDLGTATNTLVNSIIALNGTPNCVPAAGSLTVDPTSLACRDTLTNATLKLATSMTAEAGTFVLPLQTGSSAINAARPDSACPALDQRGYARPHGPHCDVGAYEFGASLAEVIATPGTQAPTEPMLQIASPTPTQAVLEIVTNTPTAVATPTVEAAALVIPTLNAFCRIGPNTLYNQVTVLQTGTAYNVIGRDIKSTWWQIKAPGSPDCWVGDANVGKQGPVDQAPVVQGPPLPGAPGNFVNSFVCDLKMKSLGVSFNWAAASGETGYRLYRNGTLLTTIDASQTSYHDAAPLGMELVYELEAFNANGVAPRLSTNVPACK